MEQEQEQEREHIMLDLKRSDRTGFWYVRVTVPGRVRKKLVNTHARTREQAERIVTASGVDRLELLAQAGALTAEGISIVTAGRVVVWSEAFDLWKGELYYSLAPETARKHAISGNAFLRQFDLGGKPLAAATREMVDTFINHEESSFSNRRRHRSAILHLFRYVQAKGFLIGNPAELSRIRKREMPHHLLEPKQRQAFTQEEFDRMLPKEGFWRHAMILSYYTGLRLGDVCSLEWDSIGRNEIIVHTMKRGRRVALPLDNPLIGHPLLKEAIFQMRLDRMGRRAQSPFCFPEKRDRYVLRSSDLSKRFTEIALSKGVAKSYHELRHAFVTRLATAGVDLEQIGRLVGHADVATTEIYDHSQSQ